MSSELDRALDEGDVPSLMRGMIRGLRAEAAGEFCSCEVPDLVGRKSILCFQCGRPNDRRRAEIEAEMAAPHAFEPMGDVGARLVFCDFCTMRESDARHQVANGEQA